MIDLEELKKLAWAATPGPWELDVGYMSLVQSSKYPICKASDPRESKFIAAANPAVVLDLIEQFQELSSQFISSVGETQAALERADRAEKELDALRAQMKKARGQEPVATVAQWVGARSRRDRITLNVDVPMGHTFLKGERLYAAPVPAQQSYHQALQLLAESRENFEKQFGSSVDADWVYKDLAELFVCDLPAQQSPAVAVTDDWNAQCTCGHRWRAVMPTENCPSCNPSPRITEQCPVMDLDKNSWDSIKEAAKESNWIPKEYFANDWVSDVCEFLKNGIKRERITEQDAREILENFCYEYCSVSGIDEWCQNEGIALLDKLNGAKNEQ